MMETLLGIAVGGVIVALGMAVCFFLFLICKASYDEYKETRK